MNFSESSQKLGIAALFLILMLAAFLLLQHWRVYQCTLGLFSKNYEHLENDDIVQKKMPYTSLTNDNFLHWDAAHYQHIRDHNYDAKAGEASFAFFPLFPWIWKITHLNAVVISLFNYVLFAISLLLLSSVFVSKNIPREQRLLLYALALLLPGTVVFNMPYTESVFIFTFSLACYFLKKGIRWMFMFFLVLFAFTRPAITIILVSLISTDVYFTLTGKGYQIKPFKIAMRIVPILLGTVLALYIQQLYSGGNWFKVFEVQRNWGYHAFQFPTKFDDWSKEGYSMSVFTLLGVFLPAVYYLISSFLKKFTTRPQRPEDNKGFEKDKEYLFVLSLFYLTGITLFTLFFRGGSLNGLQRYALATPFFYIIFFTVPEKLASMGNWVKILMLTALLVCGTVIFATSSYSSGVTFPHTGFY
ncbi:MAG TPA: hypothetical protein VIH57_01845, partial [Bacteroidales bacterium]